MIMYVHVWSFMVMYGYGHVLPCYEIWLSMVLHGHKMDFRNVQSFESKESILPTVGSKCQSYVIFEKWDAVIMLVVEVQPANLNFGHFDLNPDLDFVSLDDGN